MLIIRRSLRNLGASEIRGDSDQSSQYSVVVVTGKGKPYHYVRFRWWGGLDVEVLRSEFEKDYEVGLKFPPRDDTGISIQAESARELRVRSDTLTAFMSPFRVVLAQRERAPFTRRDMYLRGRVIELYPQSRPTPFPWLFSGEPEFEVEEERKASDW